MKKYNMGIDLLPHSLHTIFEQQNRYNTYIEVNAAKMAPLQSMYITDHCI